MWAPDCCACTAQYLLNLHAESRVSFYSSVLFAGPLLLVSRCTVSITLRSPGAVLRQRIPRGVCTPEPRHQQKQQRGDSCEHLIFALRLWVLLPSFTCCVAGRACPPEVTFDKEPGSIL